MFFVRKEEPQKDTYCLITYGFAQLIHLVAKNITQKEIFDHKQEKLPAKQKDFKFIEPPLSPCTAAAQPYEYSRQINKISERKTHK